MSTIRMEVAENLEAFLNLREKWQELELKVFDGTVFQSFLWNYIVCDSFDRIRELKVFYFLDRGALIGILPLRVVSRRLLFIDYKIVNFLTHNRADWQSGLFIDKKTDCIKMFLEFLHRKKIGWDLVYLRNISKLDNLSELIVNLSEESFSTKVAIGINCRIVNVESDFEKYCATLKSKMLSNLRRCEKRLKEKGELVIESFDGDKEELSKITNEFIKLHIKRWAVTDTPSKFLNQKHCDYYQKLFEELYSKGYLDLYYIKYKGKYIAFHFGTRYLGKYLSHTPCFDPDFSKSAPSKILLFHIIKSCFEKNDECFNFLAGEEEYKKEWTDFIVPSSNCYIFRNAISKLFYNIFFNEEKFKLMYRFKKSI